MSLARGAQEVNLEDKKTKRFWFGEFREFKHFP